MRSQDPNFGIALDDAPRREHVIYAITHIRSGRRYIGRTINEEQRIYTHRSNLRCNRHWCPELQDDWNTEGAKAFSFDILERGILSEEEAKTKEIAHIVACADIGLYNYHADIHPKTGRLKLIDIRRQRMSDALKRAWDDPDCLLRTPKRTRWDIPGQREAQSQSQKQRYADPTEREKTAIATRDGLKARRKTP